MTLFRPTIPRIPGDGSALPGEVRQKSVIHVQQLRPLTNIFIYRSANNAGNLMILPRCSIASPAITDIICTV